MGCLNQRATRRQRFQSSACILHSHFCSPFTLIPSSLNVAKVKKFDFLKILKELKATENATV